jgi:hypothetical protein
LQTKETEADPWTQVHIDLVGPLPVQTPSGTKYLSALTCIDPATGWFEMIEVPDKTTSLSWKRFMISGYADIHVLKWYHSTTETNSKQNPGKRAGTLI